SPRESDKQVYAARAGGSKAGAKG
ncbi:hypothetical protein MNBD_PLANCTO03-175, partial [hydrothermal vent metagenome]